MNALPLFPRDFLWGTATSAHQIEGHNEHNDWWHFERKLAKRNGRHRIPRRSRGPEGPSRRRAAVTKFTPSGAACDFWNRFEDDLDGARALGTNAFRFSLEWSRVEPRPRERDERAAERYDEIVAACRARGLKPVLTLAHFTLPRWCAERGGWLAPETLEAFERHVTWVAERYGGAVDTFVTVNEPNVQAGAGYVSGVFAPGRRFRPDLADRCEAALVRAHARAYHVLHERIARLHPNTNVQVGPAPHLIAWRPSGWDLLGAVKHLGSRFNWGFLNALEMGEIRFDSLKEEIPEARGAFDFVGVNYYMALPAHLLGFLRFAGLVSRPARPGTSDMGWPIDATGFEESLVAVHRRYGKPIIVTENGIADATDALRPGYLRDHVAALERAMRAGARVRGYLHWSLLDNFEWHEGYGPRFGLYAVDYATQERTLRKSGELYRDLIAERRSGPARSGSRRLAEVSL
jgi:beta-glucosidase